MKKKIFSILLLLSILVPCLPASAKNSIVNDQIPRFLNTFGFITSKNMAADPAEEISRGEFSQYAVNLLDLKYTNDEYVPYSDVKETRSDYEAIKILNDMGCVKGFGDFTYRPDEKIETEHAVSIILRVMGYGDKYTDVFGFKNLAVGKGLYSGISSVAALTRKDAFRLVYNALNAEVGDLIYKGSDTDGKTLLTERFKIYFVKGQVTDDGVTAFTGSSKIKNGSLLINDEEFINKTGEKIGVGITITGYYVVEADENILKFFYTDEKTNSVVEYKDDYIESFDGGYTYEVYRDAEKNKTKKIKLDKSYKLIYNGEAFVPNKSISEKEFYKMMKPEHGSVKFIDSNGDEVYDVISITNYLMIIVGGVDRVNKTVYDKSDPSLSINFEEIDDYRVYNVEDPKRDMAIERIVADNIIYAAISYDKSCAQILVSNKTVTGKYDKKTSDEIVMGEEIYKFSKEYKEFIKTNPISDVRETVYYLSPENEIVFHKLNPGDNDLSFAFLYEIIRGDDESTGEECLMARVYTHDNEYKTVKLADAVTVDGIRYKKNKKDVIYNLIKRHKYGEGSMIAVKYNSDNEIKFIDMAYNPEDNDFDDVTGKSYRYPNSGEGNDSLHIANGITGYTAPENYRDPQKFKVYNLDSGMIGNGELAMSTDTLVFYIPLGDNREDSFVTHTTDISYDKEGRINSSVTAYAMKDNALVADVITINNRYCVGTDLSEYSSAAASHTYIVSEVNEELNRFDEPSTHLKLYYNRNYYDFYTTCEGVADRAYCGLDASGNIYYKSVEPGDVVKVGTDKYGDIPEGQIRIMYSPSYDSDKIIYSNPSFYPSSAPQANDLINRVWINRIDGKYIEFATESPIVNTNLPRSKKYIATTGRLDYVVYENGKVKLGDATQLVSYEQTKSEDCRVITIGGLSKIQVIYTIK